MEFPSDVKRDKSGGGYLLKKIEAPVVCILIKRNRGVPLNFLSSHFHFQPSRSPSPPSFLRRIKQTICNTFFVVEKRRIRRIHDADKCSINRHSYSSWALTNRGKIERERERQGERDATKNYVFQTSPS